MSVSVKSLPPWAKQEALLLGTVTANPYIPITPTPKQSLFLGRTDLDVFFGGSAGPGKSTGLLAAALQFVEWPHYAAVLFRRTYPELIQPGGLIPTSREWLSPTDAVYNKQEHSWTFPSGAVLKFSHMQYEDDMYDHQSSEYQFIGFDELTHFTERQVKYMFSRLRRSIDSDIPLRVRSASNPGGMGHDWVKGRYVDEKTRVPGAVYIPARLEDNPHLDAEQYEKSLDHLGPTDKARLRHGDWDIKPEGGTFKLDWFADKIVDMRPNGLKLVRFWDRAATSPKPGTDPDYTAGCLMGLSDDGLWYICDMVRFRASSQENERIIRATASIDGYEIPVRMEQEPGSSGKDAIDHYARNVLTGFNFDGVPSTKSKLDRAGPLSAATERGHVYIVRAEWTHALIDEMVAFNGDGSGHDDQVDAATGAMKHLSLNLLSPSFGYDDKKADEQEHGWKSGEQREQERSDALWENPAAWVGEV